MTEEEIIKGCIKNDRRSQNELYKRYFFMMSGIALRYYESEDDAMQGLNYGFMKVLKNLKSYDPKFTLATWIRNVLVHHFIDDYRKQNKHITSVHLQDVSVPDQYKSINLAEFHFSEQDLRNMLDRLPSVTRKVFNLYAIEGYKHSEIGDMLGISDGTSKWHVSEARKKLGLMLEEAQEEEKKIIGSGNE